jgi:uncharacterized membrane protein
MYNPQVAPRQGMAIRLSAYAAQSFGIYIGRYLRYNSWDVIANPFQLTEDIWYLLLHPVRNRFDWSMILCYAVFMTLIYTAIKRMSRALW